MRCLTNSGTRLESIVSVVTPTRLRPAAILPVLFLVFLSGQSNPALAAQPLDQQARTNSADIGQNTLREPDETKLRIMGLRVGPYVLQETIPTYEYNNTLLIPLGLFAETLDLAIKVSPETGIADGFIFQERNRFHLDLKRDQLTIAGKTRSAGASEVQIYTDDIYVEADRLSEWMPFTVDVDLYSSLLTIKSEEKFPFISRLERKRRFDQVNKTSHVFDKGYPRFFEPYASWTTPKINATIRGSLINNSTGTTGSVDYSIHGTNDVFKLESTLYLTGTDKEPVSDGRLTLGRKDPNSQLLGPMNATEFAFGHLSSPVSNRILRSSEAQVGAMVGSYPLSLQREYDRHTFEGELPLDWEVELYHNSALIGYQQSSADGKYRFENVPLYIGTNHFRLVFHGPQGQIKEETHNFELSDAVIKPGKQYYLLQATSDADGGNQVSALYDMGLARNLSLSLGFHDLTLGSAYLMAQPPEKRQYGRLGLRGMLGGVFLTSDINQDNKGGQLSEVAAHFQLGRNTQIRATSVALDNFVSEAYPLLPDPLQSRNELSLNTAIPKSLLPRIPIRFTVAQEQYQSGLTSSSLDNTMSMYVSRLSLTNQLLFTNYSGQPSTLTGSFQLSKSTRRFSVRGEIGYSVEPSSNLTSAAVTVDNIKAGKDGILAFGWNRAVTVATDQYSLRFSRPKGNMAINASASYSSTGTTSVSVGATFGVGREPREGAWKVTATPIAGMGAASARVFMDNNGDGIFNGNDTPLPNVKLKRGGSPLPVATDAHGIAYVTNLPPYTGVDLEPAMESLEDPLLAPILKGVRLESRPGAVAVIDFPIIPTGEIDGTTYLFRNNLPEEVGQVVIEIIDENGRVIKTTESAPDGFYVVSSLPMGKYLIRVSPDQIEKLGLLGVRPIQVTLSPENQFISGINFKLERR